MRVFPLVTKPCAWRIADELADFQARPTNGRPLSLGTDSTIDRDLADFVYELAGLLRQMPSSVASAEVDRNRQNSPAEARSWLRPIISDDQWQGQQAWLSTGSPWTGVYRPSNRRMELMIRTLRRGRAISGSIEYPDPDDGATTEIEGAVLERWEVDADPVLTEIAPPTFDGALLFREVREVKRGQKPVNLDGEYHAIVVGNRMSGLWVSNGLAPKPFELVSGT